jgi:hypothetical protein
MALSGRHLEQLPLTTAEQKASRKRALQREQYAAKKAGKCPVAVKERAVGVSRLEPKRHVCGAEATRKGMCRRHYNRKYLKVRANQAGGGGEWGLRRPFADWQLPGSMSDIQHECLAGLPIDTHYEACLEAMNAADPSNTLTAIYEKPGRKKSKS